MSKTRINEADEAGEAVNVVGDVGDMECDIAQDEEDRRANAKGHARESYRKRALKARWTRAAGKIMRGLELPPVELDGSEEEAVAMLAASVGLTGESLDVMAQTWMRPIADEGLGATGRGLNRVRAVARFLGAMVGGMKTRKALAEAGLTWGNVSVMFRRCPELRKMYDRAFEIMREARRIEIGEKVEDAALELATVGEDVYDRHGDVIGKRRNIKAIEMLLPQAGAEYAKAGRAAVGAGGEGGGGGITLNFHFDGKEKGQVVEAQAVDVAEVARLAEVADV